MKIERVERKGSTVRLCLQDGSTLSLPRAVLREHPLREGQSFDPESYLQAAEPAMNKAALERAVWWLSKKDMSERQLREKLKGSGFTPESAQRACDRLKEGRYLDDARLSENIVRQKMKAGGPRKIAALLRQKGIEEETAREALVAMDDGAQLQSALGLARRYLRGKSLEPREAARRCGAYLARRGFGWDVIRAALSQAGGDEEEGWGPEG